MTRRTLVIGYGNVLRQDDGVGWQVAQAIADLALPDVDVLLVQQLTPELASDLGDAAEAVLVDADRGLSPGAWRVDPLVEAETTPPPATSAWSHHVGPDALLRLARELYGRAPRLSIVRVGVASVDAGEGLSPIVAAAVPRITADIVERLLVRAEPLVGASHA